jgi:hypothetical protein
VALSTEVTRRSHPVNAALNGGLGPGADDSISMKWVPAGTIMSPLYRPMSFTSRSYPWSARTMSVQLDRPLCAKRTSWSADFGSTRSTVAPALPEALPVQSRALSATMTVTFQRLILKRKTPGGSRAFA